ncbi:Site-specific recombinase XerD-like protein [Natronococcus amylolyticus DSM 10524]|uniref:Site-specific recombinase XerD-like protein n=1 Tax=Natronococcus amylolyticus DSM 10524 TaxID=1227497 RepID=L9WYV8_9EURY|nr:Site-specific recombinase XerD-like protein [Natronococcus amylolyticus DSM 10524]
MPSSPTVAPSLTGAHRGGGDRVTDISIADAVDVYLERKALGDPDGSGAGTYAANAESVLRRWVDWLVTEHDLRSISALGTDQMRAYAEALRARTDEGTYAASTARTYYAVVRAFLSWCVRSGLRDSNPAAAENVTAALPPTVDGDAGSKPGWTADRRHVLERHVRERAIAATSEDRDRETRRDRLREYALIALFLYSDVRGSELFRVPRDDRRTGAIWDDVDFYTGTIRVLGRSQRLEEVVLPAAVRTPLRRYRVTLDPPSNDWPLFPTRHAPSIARRVREALRERGHDEAAIDTLLADSTATELARERSIAPPAITTEGARSVLKRLCREAGLEVDGDSLTPRGARDDSRGDGRYRREATSSSPALRASVMERSIVVSASREGPGSIIDLPARVVRSEERNADGEPGPDSEGDPEH